jgi:hypothetical protein
VDEYCVYKQAALFVPVEFQASSLPNMEEHVLLSATTFIGYIKLHIMFTIVLSTERFARQVGVPGYIN